MIVDDDFLIADYLQDLCESMGHRVAGIAGTADDALAVIHLNAPDTILMDVRLQSFEDGVDVANKVHKARPDTRIIYITGSNEPPTIARIQDDSPYRILVKPISADALAEALA